MHVENSFVGAAFLAMLERRGGLAVEIVTPIAVDKFRLDHVQPSVDHIERLLGLSEALERLDERSEDFLETTRYLLDDLSYYACMAIPLIRQIQYPCNHGAFDVGDKFLTSGAASIPEVVSTLGVIQQSEGGVVCGLPSLAKELKTARETYVRITTTEELLSWSRDFLVSFLRVAFFSPEAKRIHGE